MTKLEVLKNIKFGQSVAEEEALTLEEYFVETTQWAKVYNGEVDIIYGPKGSGKSALYSLVDKYEPQFFENNVCLRFAENPRGAMAFTDLQIDPPPDERSFVALWKLYILALIGEHFSKYGTQTTCGSEVLSALRDSKLLPENSTLKIILGSVKNYLLCYFKPQSIEPKAAVSGVEISCKITFTEPSADLASTGVKSVDTLLMMANEELQKSTFTIWFLLDRLDVAFTESPVLEENALRALFKTYLDLAGYSFIKLKIFLRSDIWKRITKTGFREATHITRCTDIYWERSSLLNLIIRRFINSQEIRKFYDISKDAIASSVEQEKLFYRIFPRQVDTGRHPDTLDWIIGRTKDSSGFSTPRDIINLINGAINSQAKAIEIGQNEPDGEMLFTRAALKNGLEYASKEKVEKYLFAEYPSLRHYFDLLRGGKSHYSLSALAKTWKCHDEEALPIADSIVDAGFWRKEKKDPPEYWIEFIFRDGLDIIQGTAE